ncbi:hypothetical protein J2T57_002530 [Natronocella acetinitrilica]|jgi:hypothetical protein|uniref:PA2779 family protein n=1 Tax=Natronocella acetinitrilica TaxID=414046 RepID=A0AAE3KBD2_9GAMM|nr:PA2779 family protein [Natronocella acetinitrilica]MCP1675380.1 hypothetical protein [Natronocella acetinitrilica]
MLPRSGSSLTRGIAASLALLFALMSIMMPTVHAGMIGTADYASSAAVAEQRADVRALLARDDVREQLIAWGVDPDDAAERVDSLTADELAQLSEQMESMPAGAGVGSVVGAVVFIFLVLLITDILGVTDVFPFVKKTVN